MFLMKQLLHKRVLIFSHFHCVFILTSSCSLPISAPNYACVHLPFSLCYLTERFLRKVSLIRGVRLFSTAFFLAFLLIAISSYFLSFATKTHSFDFPIFCFFIFLFQILQFFCWIVFRIVQIS